MSASSTEREHRRIIMHRRVMIFIQICSVLTGLIGFATAIVMWMR